MSLKVLYLDDEPDLCSVFTELFSTSEVEVFSFEDASKAIVFALRNQTSLDLIFLDFRLPQTNGDEVAVAMKALAPIYLITGATNVEPQFPYIKIMRKPFKVAEIREIIQSVARSKQSRG